MSITCWNCGADLDEYPPVTLREAYTLEPLSVCRVCEVRDPWEVGTA